MSAELQGLAAPSKNKHTLFFDKPEEIATFDPAKVPSRHYHRSFGRLMRRDM